MKPAAAPLAALAALFAIALSAAVAQAQSAEKAQAGGVWYWQDAQGRRVISDRAPPPQVAERQILKRPASGPRVQVGVTPLPEVDAPTSVPVAAAATGAAAAASSGAAAGVANAASAAALQAATARKQTERQAVCKRAMNQLVTLQAGTRLATTNAQGERAVMDDAARAQQTQRVQAQIKASCS